MNMIEFLNMAGGKWLPYLFMANLQNALFLAIVFLVLSRLKQAPAGIRYLIAMLGLVKFVVPPFIPSQLIPTSAVSLVSVPELPSTILFAPTAAVSGSAMPARAHLDLAGLLFLLWIVVAAAYLLFCAISTLRFARLLRSAEQIDDPALRAQPEFRRIRILKSGAIDLPLTLGVFPGSIFVPETWDRWNSECKRFVLLHEAAHLRRYDSAVQTLQIIVQAGYFYNPLVWVLNRRLAQYREMACDDVSVASQPTSRLTYSRYLVEIAESLLRTPVRCDSASALIKRRNELLTRVQYQLRGGTMKSISRRVVPVVLAGLIVLMLPLSWYYSSGTSKAAGEQKLPRTAKTDQYVDLNVMNDHQVVIDGATVSHERYIEKLREIFASMGQDAVIKLVCADEVSMSFINKIQRQLIDAGLTRVEFRNSSGAQMPLALPSEKIAQRMKEIPEEHIVHVHIGASGSVTWNKARTPAAELGQKMQWTLASDENAIVSIQTDDDATYGDFLSALRQLKQAGAKRIFINLPAN